MARRLQPESVMSDTRMNKILDGQRRRRLLDIIVAFLLVGGLAISVIGLL